MRFYPKILYFFYKESCVRVYYVGNKLFLVLFSVYAQNS